MIELFARLLLAAALLGGEVHEGVAPHYAAGVMERVAGRRGMEYPACAISSPYWPVGARVWVYGVATQRLERCTVVDVSHPRDRARHLRTRRVAELGEREARRLCPSIRGRPEECKIVVVRL